jgi:hypothetical protein
MTTSQWRRSVTGDAPGRQNAGGSTHTRCSSFRIRRSHGSSSSLVGDDGEAPIGAPLQLRSETLFALRSGGKAARECNELLVVLAREIELRRTWMTASAWRPRGIHL